MSMTVSKLRWSVLLYGIVFIGYSVYEAIHFYNPVTPVSERLKDYNLVRETHLFKSFSIIESWTYDTLNGSGFSSEFLARDQMFNPKTKSNERRFNLLDDQYRHLPKIFSAYYFLIAILWAFVFYYLYRLCNIFYKDNVFYYKNPKLLEKLGKTVVTIGSAKFFSIMVLSLIINLIVPEHVFQNFNYDMFLEFLFLMLIGNILMMLSNAFTKGITLEQEQELVI